MTVRLLSRADLAQMATWRPFNDALYDDANWPLRSQADLERWYHRAQRDAQRLLCAVTDEAGQMIGSITLRERDGTRSARLGVTLGADFVNQGYGTEALALFLDYYFRHMGFERIVLDVVGYNKRAIHVYEKLGFVKVGEHERSVGRSKKWAFLQEPRYVDVRPFFRRDWLGRQYLLCYDMELRYEDWDKRREDLIHW